MVTPALPPRYTVCRPLGSGASGEVLLARDRDTGMDVAVKLFFPEEAPGAESAGEIAALRALAHERIVRLLDHGVHEGRPYTVCEYVRGLSLKDYLAAARRTTPDELARACDFLLQLLGALDHMHGAGLVHRDLKPANVHLEFTAALPLPPERELVASPFLAAKLLDFGFARKMRQRGESFAGTLGYAAPEQLRTPALGDERADLFSFGVILYETLTGALPFPTMQSLVRGVPPAPPHAVNALVPERVSALTLALLAESPFARPASAAEVAERLEQGLHEAGVALVSAEPPATAPPAAERDALFAFLHASTRPHSMPARQFLERFRAATGGLPVLCAPYLEALAAAQRLARRFGELVLAAQMPGHVQPTAYPALDAGHDEEEKTLLGLAACLREFTEDEAAAAAELPPERLHAALERLAGAGLLHGDGKAWSFTASLAREHFAAVLAPDRARAFHARCAELRRGSPPEVRAFHLRGAGRDDEAFALYLQAAHEAQVRGQFDDARVLLDDAFTLAHTLSDVEALRAGQILLAVGAPRRAVAILRRHLRAGAGGTVHASDLLLAAGRAEIRIGEFAEARESFSRAAELLDAQGTARELLECERGIGAACRSMGDLAEAEAAYRRMAARALAANDRAGMIEALHGSGLVAKDRGDFAAAEQDLRRAASEAERIGDRRRAAVAHHNLGNVLRAVGKHQEAADCFRTAIAVRKAIGDRQGLAITYTSLAQEDAYRGDLRAALDALAESYRLFLEAGDRKGLAVTLINRGTLLGVRGELDEGLATLLRATHIAGRLGDIRSALEADLAAAELLLLRGSVEAEEMFARIRSAPTSTDRIEARALAGLASAALRRGALDEAQSLAERASAFVPSEQNAEDHAELRGLCADVLRERGFHEAAVEAAEDAYAHLPETASPLARGRLARVLGEAWLELGPMWADRTEKHLREADTLLTAAGHVYEHARARFAWARYLAYAGETRDAFALAAEAQGTFAALKAAYDVARITRFRNEVS